MLKVGLTGGIGSGKSTVAAVFEKLGVPVYYSDARAKELMCSDILRTQIVEVFSEQVYNEDGMLNRAVMAEQVFGHPERLAQLNAIVHPAVERDFLSWASAQDAPYVIQEAAILIESGAHRQMDQIVVVKAPLETRIKRVVKRDGASEEQVLHRIKAQILEEEREKYANYTILADGKEMLLPQIIKIDSELRKKMYICTL